MCEELRVSMKEVSKLKLKEMTLILVIEMSKAG